MGRSGGGRRAGEGEKKKKRASHQLIQEKLDLSQTTPDIGGEGSGKKGEGKKEKKRGIKERTTRFRNVLEFMPIIVTKERQQIGMQREKKRGKRKKGREGPAVGFDNFLLFLGMRKKNGGKKKKKGEEGPELRARVLMPPVLELKSVFSGKEEENRREGEGRGEKKKKRGDRERRPDSSGRTRLATSSPP